ncbi:unnamed protein product, partial [marine sediment metagenome]
MQVPVHPLIKNNVERQARLAGARNPRDEDHL